MNIFGITNKLIDEHYYLDRDDDVYYMEQYYPGKGYVGVGNSLILNLKKSPAEKDSEAWRFKQKAINDVASRLSKLMNSVEMAQGTVHWIPVPPSKVRSHQLFDDRIYDIVKLAVDLTHNKRHVVADVFSQKSNRNAFSSSSSSSRRDVYDLASNYSMNNIENYNSESDFIVIFDDMLTTGCHFKAIKNIILSNYSEAKISGVFVARRVLGCKLEN